MTDYNDEQVLRQFSFDTIQLANQYQEARIAFGEAKFQLKRQLIDGYRDKTIPLTIAEDKAFLRLVSLQPELEDVFEDYIKKEQIYKGIEKVLDARKQHTSQEQSFIKNRIQENA